MFYNYCRALAAVAGGILAVSLLLTFQSSAPPAFAQATEEGTGAATVSGELKKWHPLTLDFAGPSASETDASPNNPFLDYRLQVTFTGPSGQTYTVPGFFDGEGNGGETGDVWRVRFAPDQAGTWSYQASFRKGTNVAVNLNPTAGTATDFDGASGTFDVAGRDAAAPGFLKWGRLEYAGKHYLKFRDGPYWLKGGADSPENWLSYEGFDNTPQAQHTFSPHVQDWQTGDPIVNTSSADGGKGLIGAMNYLSSQGVNSIYFLPMNIGGDVPDSSPYVGPIDWAGSPSNDNLHFDISKLGQWETAFAHAQQKGLHLHFVLGEAEAANKLELDDATLGVERKLFYRELVARYGHHNSLQWNISEEYNHFSKHPLDPDLVKEFAGYVQQQDPYDHPITVHHLGNPDSAWKPFIGDSRFSLTSFQDVGGVAGYGAEVEDWRQKTALAGRPITISMDELAKVTPTNVNQRRKEILWPTYLSGGQLEWFLGRDVDWTLEDFRLYEQLWTYTRYARSFVEENLPFWEMEPQDGLLSGESTDFGGGQVFAKPGQLYAVYLPNATSTGVLDLSSDSGSFQKRWYNPRTGSFAGDTETVSGGGNVSLGTPPSSPSNDWIVLLKKGDALSITLTKPADGAEYSLNQIVNADYTCEDGADGPDVQTCEGTVPNGDPIDTSSAGTKTFTVNATDNAGKTTSVTHSYTVSACTITGTSGNDVLEGTSGDDTICGLGGNDTIRGLGGNDTLQGGNGSDTIEGGTGNDTVDGGAGTDYASFKNSATGVQASLVTNTATGEGSDTLAAIERLEGSNFNDQLTGSSVANTLKGLSGVDTITGGDGNDTLTGNGGNDTLYGGLGNDSMTGHAGADTFYGQDGADTLNSRDSVNGNDTLDGGAGTDTCTTDSTEKSIVGCP